MAQPDFGGGVVVEGLDGLERAVRRVDSGLAREMRKRLLVAGTIVAEQAKQIAEFRGLRGEEDSDRHKGALISRIRPTVRGSRVFVRDSATTSSAKWPSYSYPSRFEYQQGGSRAFMRPALQTKREEVVAELGRVVDWVADEWGA